MSEEIKARVYDHFEGRRLKLGLQIEITDDPATDSKRVAILAKLYVNKRLEPTFCYGSCFTDADILRDNTLGTFLIDAYGV